MKEVVQSSAAPAAIGPYSQAVHSGGFIFCSGQIPLDPVTGNLVEGGVTEQTTRVIENIIGLLSTKGLTLDNVVKSSVFMTDLGAFADMNAVYSKYFKAPFPARSTFQVAALPKGSQVEIEVIVAVA